MGRLGPKICGLKLSACCTVFAAWGNLQLGILGFCFGIKSITLLKSVIPDHEAGKVNMQNAMYEYETLFIKYKEICYTGALFCFVIFLISLWQCCNNIRFTSGKIKKDEDKKDPYKTLKEAIEEEEPKQTDKILIPDSTLKYIKIEK